MKNRLNNTKKRNHRDRDEDQRHLGSLVEDEALAEKLQALQARQDKEQAKLNAMEEDGEKQYSSTDKDARLLYKRGQRIAGYNVQQGIDSKHKLIIAHEVTHDCNDVKQLLPMVEQTRAIIGQNELTVVADSGYYNPEQIKACQDLGITPYVAIPDKSKAIEAQGRYTRDQFQYNGEQNYYRCPAGQRLDQQGAPYNKRGKTLIRYTSKPSDCRQCEHKTHCLTEKARVKQINRWEHEQIVEAHRERMQRNGKEMMRCRSGLAEHPFGTLKRWFGWDHFLVRGFSRVKGEMSLMVLGYNLMRVIRIIGLEAFKDYCALNRRKAEGATV